MLKTVGIASLLVIAFISTASAQFNIGDDRGGQIGVYLIKYAALRESGQDVKIDGNCVSACTLILGTVPSDRVCVTSKANLGFHAAWKPDDNGFHMPSPLGTQALRDHYPAWVNRWIDHHGGLTPHMIHMPFATLQQHFRVCGAPPKTHVARRHRTPPHRIHYASARVH